MKNLILLFFYLSIHSLFAQNPKIIWEKTFGGTKNDQAQKIILCSDNNYLLIGYTQAENRYDLDLWISKINTNGTTLWEKTFGNEQLEMGYDAVEDTEGNFFISGIKGTTHHSNQIWLLKVDQNGKLIWEKEFGGSNSDIGKSILLTKESHILIGGSLEGEITAFNHAYRLVLDKDGHQLTANKYGGDLFEKEIAADDKIVSSAFAVLKGETCNKIITSRFGGYIFVGTTITKAKMNLATDGWLVKLNEKGQIIWDKNIGAIGGDNLLDIVENEKGEIFTIGEYYNKPKSKMSIWLSKFDRQGKLLFEKNYGQKNLNSGQAIQLLANGEILLCGYSSDRAPLNIKYINPDTISTQKLNQLIQNKWRKIKVKKGKKWIHYYEKEFPLTPKQLLVKTDRNFWLAKVDSNGNLIWEKEFGGIDDDELSSMILDKDNYIIIAGYTRSKGKGLKDIYIAKLKFE
ncbi:MAG TPA: hypothetical protein ENK52_00980 [Saprospiraceae bacterium]|nr:hypothetical protein [Saprospiraceae bacterium]